MINPALALSLIAAAQFRPFDDNDHMAFQGTNAEYPSIAEIGNYIIINDGDRVCLIDENGQEQQFVLGENLFA